MIKAKHYFEIHITVLEADDFERFRDICDCYAKYEWKASRFQEDDVDNMDGQWFCSLRVQTVDVIFPAIREMRDILKANGYMIARIKAEDTLFDTKCGDKLD